MAALVEQIAGRSARRSGAETIDLIALKQSLLPGILQGVGYPGFESQPRGEKAAVITRLLQTALDERGQQLNSLQQRNLVTALLEAVLSDRAQTVRTVAPCAPAVPETRQPEPVEQGGEAPVESLQALLEDCASEPVLSEVEAPRPAAEGKKFQPEARRQDEGPCTAANKASVEEALEELRPRLMDRMDVAAASKLTRGELAGQITELVTELLKEIKLQLNAIEARDLVTILVNDMLGLGPLEPLLADEAVTDILVNGPHQIYVERGGKLVLTDITFRDNAHVMMVCTRIVSKIGRRVDESSPLVDARLEDGSRVNIIIPPLAIDGPSISIRKFSEKKITLEVMEKQGNISTAMCRVLQIASRARLNVLISGGTGSGKTTMLNAMSRMIDTGERVVTIEDAAELQLQQPHVVRLETRPPNLEGRGEITMRDLVKNALRMRPDRIILGEVRGGEALDMLQAMNTGHEGSMGTVHANNPREALTRLENMLAMANVNLPPMAMRTQIASAIDLIIQVSRMRDGMRRVTSVSEVVGMEGEIITMQELFSFKFEGEDQDGKLLGHYEPSGLRPHFAEKASYFGLEKTLLEALK